MTQPPLEAGHPDAQPEKMTWRFLIRKWLINQQFTLNMKAISKEIHFMMDLTDTKIPKYLYRDIEMLTGIYVRLVKQIIINSTPNSTVQVIASSSDHQLLIRCSNKPKDAPINMVPSKTLLKNDIEHYGPWMQTIHSNLEEIGGRIQYSFEGKDFHTFEIFIPLKAFQKDLSSYNMMKRSQQMLMDSVSVLIIENNNQLALEISYHIRKLLGLKEIIICNEANVEDILESRVVAQAILIGELPPEQNALELLLKLKNHPTKKTLPVIALARNGSKAMHEKFVTGGAFAYLSMPVQYTLLAETVCEAIISIATPYE